jgi:4-amino-4-deoxy-L-arabinose transferase-like glycosyltransferase
MAEASDGSGSGSTACGGGGGASLRNVLRDGGKPLLVVLALGGGLAIALLAEFFATSPLATALFSDPALYHDWAVAIAGGDLLGKAEPYHHPPLYPHLVALVYSLAGAEPFAAALVQTLLLPLALLLAYGTARRFAARGAALLVVLGLALYLPPAFYATRLLAESLAALAIGAFLFLADPAAVRRSATRAGLTGLALGAACALRPDQLLFAILVVPALAWQARGAPRPRGGGVRTALALALGVALPILPFFLRNAIHAGEPVLLCDTGGVNLFLAHHAGAGASFRTDDPLFGDVATQPAAARAVAVAATRDPDLTWREVGSHLAGRALRFAVEQPLAELRLAALRARAFFSNFEYGIIYVQAAERDGLLVAKLFVVPFAPFAALWLAGLLAAWRRRDRATLPLVLHVAACLLVVLAFFQYSRFRVVALASIVPLAALGLDAVLRAIAARRLAPEILAAIVGLALALLPAGSEAREQVANARVTLAEAHRIAGDLESAERELARVVASGADVPRLALERARLLRARAKPQEALDDLAAELARREDQPVLWTERARILLREPAVRDGAAARAAARRAVDLAPGLEPAQAALGEALALLAEWTELERAMAIATRYPTASPRLFALHGAALVALDRRDEADAALARALAGDPASATALAALYQLRRRQGRDAEASAARDRLREVAPEHPLARN